MGTALRLLCVVAVAGETPPDLRPVLGPPLAAGAAIYLLATAETGREAAVRELARALGLRGARTLAVPGGTLGQDERERFIAALARQIRQLRPHAVLACGGPLPDQAAVALLTGAAVVCAADAAYGPAHLWAAHQVQQLSIWADPSRGGPPALLFSLAGEGQAPVGELFGVTQETG